MTIESRNPADDDSLAGMMRIALRKFLQKDIDDMLPARVISHDRAANRVQVQPLIAMVDTSGRTMPRAPVEDIQVVDLGGGGFFINFNLNAGDLGWIKASDRDISLFKQSYTQSQPNTRRLHSFSDAVFVPDVMTGYTIAEEDASAMVIQNLAGTVKISLSDQRIKIAAPDIQLESSTLTHNGTNIGDNHVHRGVSPGGSNTQGPQ